MGHILVQNTGKRKGESNPKTGAFTGRPALVKGDTWMWHPLRFVFFFNPNTWICSAQLWAYSFFRSFLSSNILYWKWYTYIFKMYTYAVYNSHKFIYKYIWYIIIKPPPNLGSGTIPNDPHVSLAFLGTQSNWFFKVWFVRFISTVNIPHFIHSAVYKRVSWVSSLL